MLQLKMLQGVRAMKWASCLFRWWGTQRARVRLLVMLVLIWLLTGTAWAQAAPVKVPKPAQVVKQLTGAASRTLGLKGPGRLLFGLAVIAVIVLGFYFWKRKKGGGSKSEVAPEAVSIVEPTVAVLAPRQLIKVWKGFLNRLPRVFRRSIHNFQSFVVVGPPASGKSTVVTTYSDWQRQARQGLPSETQSPHLQIYLSSQAVLIEAPAGLLQDTSVAARRAFTKLFSRVAVHRSPVVAVVLDLPALQKMSPEAARGLADGIRAKVNVLADARRRRAAREPVEVRLVLTHLDSIAGFDALVEFAQLQDMALRFPLGQGPDESTMAVQVSEGVSGFGAYLPLALTKLSSARYKEVLIFLREGPRQFENLGSFLSALFTKDSLSQQPRAGDVYLTCDRVISQSSNPFHVPYDATLAEGNQPVGLHSLAAYAGGALAAVWLLLGFGLERQSWQEATSAMRGAMGRTFPAEVRDAVRSHRNRGLTLQRMLPEFYDGSERDIEARLSRNIREHELLPRLEEAMLSEHWPYRKALYHLALVHGGRDNALGSIALELGKGPLGDEIGAGLIADYISATSPPFAQVQSLERLRMGRGAGRESSSKFAFDAVAWRGFLQDIREAIDRGHVVQAELDSLILRAKALQQNIRTIHKFERSHDILRHLPAYKSVFEDNLEDLDAPSSDGNLLAPMTALLDLIVATGAVQEPELERITLTVFSNRIRAIAAEKATSRLFTVQLRAKTPGADVAANVFEVNRNEWNGLIRKSRIRNLASAFATQAGHANEIFFREGLVLANVSVDVVANCLSKAPSKVVLDGHYTRLAYKVHVRPALEQFLRATSSLTDLLPAPELLALRANIQRKVIQYASSYRSQVDNFYDRGFSVCAGRGDSLALAFGELAQSTSSLTGFLDVVDTNTNLSLALDEGQDSDSSLGKEALEQMLRPLADALAPYAAIHKAAHSAPGVPRELDGYLRIMEQVRSRLTAGAVPLAAVPGEFGLAGTLHDQLRPAGQIALERVTAPSENIAQLIEDWLAKMGLRGRLARPFKLAPSMLKLAGDRDLRRVVAKVWHHEVLLHLAPLLRKFPFERNAGVEVTSLELEQAFHPKEGLVFDRYHRFLAPVTRVVRGGYAARRGGPPLPKNMIRLLNRIGVLSNALWDDKGAPKPLEIRVRAIPFEPTRDMRSALTLAYLRFGDVSVFNFNQRPATKALSLPWGTPQISQVGVQLTNARNGNQRYPRSLVTAPSYFSALRLLNLAKAPALGATYRESDGHVLTERRWEVPYAVGLDEVGSNASQKGDKASPAADQSGYVSARFLVEEHLLDMFDFAELARQGERRFASLKSEDGVR